MTDEGSQTSLFGDVLLGEHHGDDDSGSHLEIDDFQSNEIRQIFLTTLPDYLEPVRQMVEQLLAGEEGRDVLLETLDKTLASISAAATRIEIHDVSTVVERSRARLRRVDEIDDMELRADIFGDLRELEQLSAAASGEAPPTGGSSQTLVAAFSELRNVDRSALQSLTAAGLVTVDQLRMAEPSEVVAVTGLDPSVVDAILAAVGRTSRVPRKAAPKAPHGSAAADPPEAELAQKLRDQVEAEVRMDEVRGDILELRTRLATLGDELHAAECRCCFCIEGVAGKGFVPPLLRNAPLDGTVKIGAEDAMQMTRRLHREFGLLVGTSSGANVAAALQVARDLPPGATIVTLLCDRAERYFSTQLFADTAPSGAT